MLDFLLITTSPTNQRAKHTFVLSRAPYKASRVKQLIMGISDFGS